MGKSTVGAMLTHLGVPVHESDHAVHQLLDINSSARQAIASAFPYFKYPQIYDRKTKAINRKELGAVVFNDAEKREELESILHPLVQQNQMAFISAQRAKGRQMVALDIPLLFETSAQSRVDYTLVASAPYALQKQRAMARPNMTEGKFHAILERQMPDAEKCARADFVIKTGLGRAHSMKALKLALLDIKKREGLIPEDEDEAEGKTA